MGGHVPLNACLREDGAANATCVPRLGEWVVPATGVRGEDRLEVAGNLGVGKAQVHRLRQVLQGAGVAVDLGI